jgi:hypothetical protein
LLARVARDASVLSICATAARLPRVTSFASDAETTLKYLCLVYHEEARIEAMPPDEYNALIAEVLAYRNELRERGHYLASSPLQSTHTATTLRVRGGQLAITDGPFAETREQLGGFYLIEASDLNQAIRLAANMPPARVGSIEVRPLHEFPAARAGAECRRARAGACSSKESG